MTRRRSKRVDGPVRFIVSYDICDPKRLRRVHKVMKGFGDALQYSVFICDLSPMARVKCETSLRAEINEREDQVLFINIGKTSGRGKVAVEALGIPYEAPDRSAIIV
ncbi:MAG: CRISPR-associated endonuclease Cas2 [Myxococcota bacterium]